MQNSSLPFGRICCLGPGDGICHECSRFVGLAWTGRAVAFEDVCRRIYAGEPHSDHIYRSEAPE